MAAGVPFIGLTGGLGSGKSTALAQLRELGAATISADEVVHELYRSDELRDIVVARWGDDVLAGDGAVDRSKIAERVFGHDDERQWLEQQIWPRVGQRMIDFKAAADAAAARAAADPGAEPAPVAAVVETPLLFEAGMEAAYDATIAIIAPESVRAERAAARGHVAVNERDARQLSQAEKAERATYAVENDGTPADLRDKLAAVLAQLPT
jgi:dephospho-CoA kinase